MVHTQIAAGFSQAYFDIVKNDLNPKDFTSFYRADSLLNVNAKSVAGVDNICKELTGVYSSMRLLNTVTLSQPSEKNILVVVAGRSEKFSGIETLSVSHTFLLKSIDGTKDFYILNHVMAYKEL
ncbi:hypothetical protein BGX24_005701 [Mortierella sp. AD032]|nr:hypothetical protein BGX24_005701 [Mortierella sp. AD032]